MLKFFIKLVHFSFIIFFNEFLIILSLIPLLISLNLWLFDLLCINSVFIDTSCIECFGDVNSVFSRWHIHEYGWTDWPSLYLWPGKQNSSQDSIKNKGYWWFSCILCSDIHFFTLSRGLLVSLVEILEFRLILSFRIHSLDF